MFSVMSQGYGDMCRVYTTLRLKKCCKLLHLFLVQILYLFNRIPIREIDYNIL